MRLAGPDGLKATVRDLAARETQCCSFFTFTVTPQDGGVLLDVQVPAQYADVLASLAGRATTVAAGSPGDRGVLDLVELAARADVPVDVVRSYAEAGLLPPAQLDGDRMGYLAVDVHTTRLLAGAERLGIDGSDLTGLAEASRSECGDTRNRLVGAVSGRLTELEAHLAGQLRRAAGHVGGADDWAP
nr:hypothetical protein GCM10020063_010150 [Dactylosporangium thailandense]